MLKNKIYNYFFNEIFKNFIIILFTFAAIAWVVRAVNFLDLLVDDGYSDNPFAVGYINTTTAITRIQFKFSGGNIDSGVIKMYGIT